MDPHPRSQEWMLAGALAFLLADRVFARIRLQEAQAKLMAANRQWAEARSRVRMRLMEHRRPG